MCDKQEDFVRDLLDAALRSYSKAEPRPGLEQRVIAGVRARQRSADRRWAALGAIALAGAMAVVVVVVTRQPWQSSRPTPVAKVAVHPPEPHIAGAVPGAQLPMPHRPPQSAVRRARDTRPQQFPTPRPLSKQEKLLLAYAKAVEDSRAAPEASATQNLDQDLGIPPLSIAAITIEPLTLPDGAGEQN